MVHRPQTLVVKRNTITIEVSAIPFATEISKVVVFVDHNGRPVQTATEVVVLIPATTAPARPSSTLSRPSPTTYLPSSFTQQQTPPGNPNLTQAPYSGPKTSAGGGLSNGPDDGIEGGDSTAATGLPGIAYSPYNADGTCKTGSRVISDFRKIASQYGLVRIYGVDCGQVATVVSAAKSTGLKLFLGIFDLDGLEKQIQELVDAVYAHGDWSVVESVSVGNELVNNGQATAQQVVNAVAATRQSLRSAGFRGSVVTVDTFIAVLRNPDLCDYSDFCAMNIHPFFDPNTPAAAAGKFVYNQIAAVRKVLRSPNQRIVVTETGWPWQGSANGQAVPSKDNQRVAIASIKSVFGTGETGDLILFSAFNDLWKKSEASTFFAEQYWGINQF